MSCEHCSPAWIVKGRVVCRVRCGGLNTKRRSNVLWAIGAPWFRPLYPGSIWLPHKRPKFLDPVSSKSLGIRYGTFCYYFGTRQLRFARIFGSTDTILRPVATSSLLTENDIGSNGHTADPLTPKALAEPDKPSVHFPPLP
jgi:hypothetical protein